MAGEDKPALQTDDVLREEAKAIHGKDFSGQTGKQLYRSLNGLNSAALCLSGGGIRSAVFALGVIMALAGRKTTGEAAAKPEDSLLAKFHYLSTVSGGGYVGSWLSSWIMRAGFASVWEKLAGHRDKPENEPREISWLRRYSNYLTPKLGLMSADLWADIVLILRNLILNWLVIVPVLVLLLLGLKTVALVAGWLGQFSPQLSDRPTAWLLGLAILSLIAALRFTTRHRPTRGRERVKQGTFLRRGLLPAGIAGVLFTFAMSLPSIPAKTTGAVLFSLSEHSLILCVVAPAGAAIYAAAWFAAWPACRSCKDYVWDLLAWMAAGALFGSLVAVGIYLYDMVYGSGIWIFKPGEVLLLVFALPWLILSQLLAELIFVGLTSYEPESDSDREWLARAGGWLLAIAIGWLALMLIAYVGSELAASIFTQLKHWLAPIGGFSAVVTWVLGKSGLTPAKGPAKDWKSLASNVGLAIAAPVTAVALMIVVSALLDRVLFGGPLLSTEFMHAYVTQDTLPPLPWLQLTPLLKAFAVTIVIGVISSYFVNINRFSLHALYRNRLIRCFLGASNETRRNPDPFTDFDVRDNPHMHELWPSAAVPGVAHWRPFHVVNIALNIVSTKMLAWQQRKAETFTVSPLHSGSACVAFRDSSVYGDPHGITLGTAVAISGAAVSSNMGYHTSPAISFLLTLFNGRLGWWLANPRKSGKILKREGPNFAIVPLIYEMFGQTTDEWNYVYLSDGGHFENLGLYEMVRRRCRFILVSDGGCDPEFAFEDLGNAVRKISLDLGVAITFEGLDRLIPRCEDDPCKPREYKDDARRSFAIGRIDYPAADGGGEPGIILYVKPTFYPDLIADIGVRNYGTANPDFPHESTGDQWFDESQFESYRALGCETMEAILGQLQARSGKPKLATLAEVFGELQRWAAGQPTAKS